jgi:hypothetical protein
MHYNGYVYGVVWRFEALSCQIAIPFIRCNTLEISTIRQMHYTRCCMLGFIHYRLIISILKSLIRSIEALLFPEKLFFRVGKKAVAKDILFDKFWSCDGFFERLDNVYGFIALGDFRINISFNLITII